MSRIGRLPVPVPAGVDVAIDGREVTVKGPKGTLERAIPGTITITQEGDTLVCERPNEENKTKAMHGLTRSLVNNMVIGVTTGYTKTLEVSGTGYRVATAGANLVFSLGLSHQITFKPVAGVSLAVDGQTKVKVSGIDKQLVGQVAANIRALRPPEPYKGKGIRYTDETVRRKPGKAAAKSAA